ncbi:unnamed protein product [Orchesella dallaii]|uniref:Aminopeptidase n=1 Tax=Orchesella dallaii TaxID=48710 RepID=A0ABP1QXQ0_9HEXA
MWKHLPSSFVCVQLILATVCITSAQDFRLPESIVPTHYSLQLQPILDETPGYTRFTAPGKVTITVNCTEDTATVKLHALDITIIENATAVRNAENSEAVSISSLGTEPEYHFIVINLEETLKAGSQYEIYIEFVTPVSQTRLDGMYLDSYVDPATNETKYVATTLFAAIAARRCYPSFDEPHLKAVFSISLGRKEAYHALSNMHQISTEPMEGLDGWYLDKFAPSLPMSTYLVAMIVSDMTYEEAANTEADNTTIRVYAPYYFIERGGGVYAANQTKTVLAKYEEYYNSTYMLQKLDSVSLPRFYFSAMENWALITYNDRVLLYFPGETTEQERYRITSIIAHEVAHHYFGNLVTCEWWTWIYLNEGFATYVSHLGVQMTYPEFDPWDRFINDVYQVAMEADSTSATHPVANEPATIADIGGIYDDIAYEKGASLIKMMQSFLTENVVQTGLRRYLNEKQFSNARQDELFLILQETAEIFNQTQPVSVKEIMDTWTLIAGYPLLRVSRISPSEVRFTQERFQLDPINQTWWIPITIRVIAPTPAESLTWMSNQESELVASIPDTQIFIVNPNSDGYYRTFYSSEILQALLQQIEEDCRSNTFSVGAAAKAKLLDDYITFLKAGLINDSTLESVLSRTLCSHSDTLVVWQTVFKFFTSELLQVFKQKHYSTAMYIKTYMRTILPFINGAISKQETDCQKSHSKGDDIILRADLLFWTCFIDETQSRCRDYVNEKMAEWVDHSDENSPFPVDFEEPYFCIAASLNGTYWERIYELMQKRISPGAKARLLSALSCTKETPLLERIIKHVRECFGDLTTYEWTNKQAAFAENLPSLRMTLRLMDNEVALRILYSS